MAEPLGQFVPIRLRVHPGIPNENGMPRFPASQALLDLGDALGQMT
jgi:hypothetical protein